MLTFIDDPQARTTLVGWLASKIGTTGAELVGDVPYEIAAIVQNDVLMGAVLYNNWRPPRIEMACAGEAGWVTPSGLRAAFAYPFEKLECWTVLTVVGRQNAEARAFNKKLGFRELCAVPGGPLKSRDVMLYCMTRDECRWLGKKGLH